MKEEYKEHYSVVWGLCKWMNEHEKEAYDKALQAMDDGKIELPNVDEEDVGGQE